MSTTMRLANSFASRFYREVARLSSLFLGSSELVESVFVHRSVGTGEVFFGRSDIDLIVIVRQPDSESADGPELASLYEKVCLLRRFNPAVAHMAVQDSNGLRRWWSETDTYIGSLDRRGGIWLYGDIVDQPDVPVRREDAIHRFAHWQIANLSTALRRRDNRNVRKVAADAWNTYAVATGLVEAPFLTRAQAEANWRACEDIEPATQDSEGATFRGFRLAKQLHDQLLPPLQQLRETVVLRVRMVPRFRERVFAVVPNAVWPVPGEVLRSCSYVATPELLHLYIHYVNPFLYDDLPAELRCLGFRRPTLKSFVRACRFFGHGHVTRNPGFMHRDTTAPALNLALLQHSIGYLREGRTPPPLPLEEVDALARQRPTFLDYYRKHFAGIHYATEELWALLGEIELFDD